MFRRSLCWVLPLAISLNSQTAKISDSIQPTFKAKGQLVLLDVVVTDGNGNPITHLQKDDFEIFEATDLIGTGEKQSITSFEEHKGALPRIESPPSLGPNVYTNAPAVASADSINVLLLDSLNTCFEDQTTVRRQMIEYLKTITPGPRLAIFTLGTRLRLVEGFRSDPRALIQALSQRNWGGMPQASTPVQTDAEAAVSQTVLQQMADTHASNDAIQALQGFLDEEKAMEQVSRVSVTLDAIRQLSQYLSGFPGRKNLIWFSGSFPSISFPSRGELTSDLRLERELKETVNLLAAAQIAVYPVAAQGLATEPLFQASQLAPTVVAPSPGSGGQGEGQAKSLSQKATEGASLRLDQDSTARVANTGAADELASNTGGKAFYNNNGLKEALADAVQKGSYYYSLSYSPTDKRILGRYRRIEVKLREGHYKLAYRRGYFEERNGLIEDKQQPPAADPLQRLLRRGLPDATQIVFNLRVLRTTVRPADTPVIVGDNKELHDPVARFSAEFVIPLENLDFELTDDAVRHGNIELALVAYDHNGNPLNWLFRSITTSLKPEAYAAVQKKGAGFHEEIDIPPGENYLRAGIYDLRSKKAGTIEIPLDEVGTADIVPTDIQKPQAVSTSTAALGLNSKTAPARNRPSVPSPNESTSGSSTATTLETIHQVPQSSSSPLQQASAHDVKDLESMNIPAHCAGLSPSIENSSALANVCEFALSIRRRFPDLICDREMKRYWTEYHATFAGGRVGTFDEVAHADVLTAKVTYRDGQEYYDDLQLNGHPISSEVSALPPSSLSGPWSIGEFAMVLEAIFLPSSKAEFQFKKQTRVGSARTLLFTFHITATNNRSYFLFANDKYWFPEYSGELWIDENGFQLLRLKRETVYTDEYPIRSVKTTVDYGPISLADGSSLVLPINSEVTTCAPPVRGNSDNCYRSMVKFANWHKFRATTKIVTNPTN